MTRAYYNEIDSFAAQWLRNLIDRGLIANGDVDERSIEDVVPSELAGYTQCHFFAGIGVWSHALRMAGWPDDRPVWTGSCPCQPFSSAGKGHGAADERHLWPAWFHLIEQCRPAVVFGEQVETAIKHGWLDLVQSDMEGIGYTFWPVCLPAAGFGAPHIRQRLWFVANSDPERRQEYTQLRQEQINHPEAAWNSPVSLSERPCDVGNIMGDSDIEGPQRLMQCRDGADQRLVGATGVAHFWSKCDWVPCRDGKARPVEPGTFPLAHGSTSRVGRLRAYGNSIVPQVAEALITSYLALESSDICGSSNMEGFDEMRCLQ